MRLRVLLIAVLVAGCHAPPPPHEPTTEPLPTNRPAPTPPPQSGIADGQACTDSSQCSSGICEGVGCSDQHFGACVPAQRACTRDLREYCGCDGATFSTSGSCPGRRYAHKGGC